MALVSDSAKAEIDRRRRGRLGMLRNLTPLAGIVSFLLAWQLFVVVYKMPPYLLPTPAAIAHAFIDQLPILLSNGWVTVYEMLVGYAHGGRHRHSAGYRHHLVAAFQRIRHADHAVLPDRAQGRDRASVPGLVRRRRDAENPGRLPDLVLSDRDRRRRRLALDVDGNGRSGALDGRHRAGRSSRSSGCRPACPICSAA